MNLTADVVILGGGMVGMCLAHQIKALNSRLSVLIIDKENKVGLHSSGRNSGVLHAGIYYDPGSVKAKVCVKGASRLRQWCKNENIPLLECGKLVVSQRPDLDPQLDLLLDRGMKNGAEVYLIDERELSTRMPFAKTHSGRALWSPGTSVVKPKSVVDRLKRRLQEMGVDFRLGYFLHTADPVQQKLFLTTTSGENVTLSYGHLFNASGLQADTVAKQFGLAKGYKMLPFKGIYWKLDPASNIRINTNLYPVPDLNVPFLGVHFTPSPDGVISLGPTAIPALGRENYTGVKGIEPLATLSMFNDLTTQWIKNNGGFRKYASEQALHGFKSLFVKAAQQLVPSLKPEHLLPSEKVGIRAQLFDQREGKLVQDFLLQHDDNSTHVLNAISPAFTASFELADHILDNSQSFTSKL